MKSFQLDENINSKNLVENCDAEGKCKVLRFPAALCGTKDPELLPDLLTREAPLVTTDSTIVNDSPGAIPERNSGLIVVKQRAPTPPFTAKRAAVFIANFKSKFPGWPEFDWSGLYVEISDTEAYVSALRDGDVSGGTSIDIGDEKFSEKFIIGAVASRDKFAQLTAAGA